MKKLIIITAAMMITSVAFCQEKIYTTDKSFRIMEIPAQPIVVIKSDTLFIVEPRNLKFIKVGDKVYRIRVDLEEVKPENKWTGTIFTKPN